MVKRSITFEGLRYLYLVLFCKGEDVMGIKSINLLAFDVISSIGSKIFSFACAFYILKHTNDPLIYTIYLSLIVLSTILSQPLFGVWVDKFNNKKLVIVAQIINVIFLSIFIVKFNYIYIIILGVILNLTDGIIGLIVNSNIKNISEKDMARFVSIRQTYTVTISFLAPILGGMLIAILKIEYLALINVITELSSIFVFLFIKINRLIESKSNSNSFLKDIKVGFSYLIKNKILLNFMLVGLIINFLVNSIVVGVPIIAIQSMKLSSQQFGFTEAGMTIGMFIVSLGLSIRPLKHRLKGPFEISVILQVIALWILSLSIFWSLTVNMSFILITLVYFIAGLSLPLANIPYSIYLQNTVEEQYKGRVFSLNQSIAQSLMPVSFLIFGFILKYSHSLTYLIVSILMLVVLVYFDKTVKKEDIKF